MKEKIIHPIKPVYDSESRILILGTMPSVKSREQGFQYAHPQNRFWKVMENLFNIEINNENRKQFLHDNHIALWDVIKSCEIKGSSDSSISNVVANYEIKDIIDKSKITKVFTTGKKAWQLYQKYIFPKTNIEAICLPSTSAANATTNFNELIEKYQIIKKEL